MKLAVIGTGKIVHEAFYALERAYRIETVAIFGRPHSREKAEVLAKKYNIQEVYTDYAELLKKTAADTVYIGLVNSVHFDYAREALRAGKNVILEKPFVSTTAEAEELKEIAEQRGLFLFEAITVLHSPVFEKMAASLPRLGSIRLALLNYSQYSSRYDAYRGGTVLPAFDPAKGAGALGDINVYNIHYCVALFGVPSAVHYYANRGFNGVDLSGVLVMEYDGFQAVCAGAKDSDSPCFVSIQGEDGYMRIDGKPNLAPSLDVVYVQKDEPPVPDAAGAMQRPTEKEHIENRPYHRMTQEFKDFAQIIDERNYHARDTFLEETLGVVKVLEMAKASTK